MAVSQRFAASTQQRAALTCRPAATCNTSVFRSGAAPCVHPAARSRLIETAAAQMMATAAPFNEDRDLVASGMTKEQQRALRQLEPGYHWYETMLILRSSMSDEERDRELAKLEAFMNKEECKNISALVRGRNRMAYPIKGAWEGIYVLYTYAAKRQTARTIQLLLSNPESGSEGNIIRHITMSK